MIRSSRRRPIAAFSTIALALFMQSAVPEGASAPDDRAVALFPAVDLERATPEGMKRRFSATRSRRRWPGP